jgi:hypothetical protein
MMKLFVLVLNKTEKLEALLKEFLREEICGATVLQSTGMARVLSDYDDEDVPFLTSIKKVLRPDREKNFTIFTVLRDEQVQRAVAAVQRVVGDLGCKDTGIVFCVPVDFAKGLEED